MKIKWLSQLLRAGVILLAWVISYNVVLNKFEYSPSGYENADIFGWWCVLYISYVLNAEIITAAIVFLGYVFIGLLSVLFGWDWFYHDIPTLSELSFSDLSIVIVGGVIVASPIMINVCIKYIQRIIYKRIK
jgi:hypothetical protein